MLSVFLFRKNAMFNKGIWLTGIHVEIHVYGCFATVDFSLLTACIYLFYNFLAKIVCLLF